VVEFGQFVAVPVASQWLADGGAHVIKVESLQGDPIRMINPLAGNETRYFISRNTGKHSLPLALADPAAKPVIDALLASADVVLMNLRPGLAEKLGMGTDTLRKLFPRLIIGSVSAFGLHGEEADLAGMDLVVQARSGLMAANGRVIDGRPAAGDPVSADVMCAMTLAFGISSALLRRERTGEGGTVDTSLMQAAMTLANNQLVRSEEKDAARQQDMLTRLADLQAQGASYGEQLDLFQTARRSPMLMIYYRTYATADAHVAIACGSHSLRLKFAQALELDDPALQAGFSGDLTAHYDRLASTVERRMASYPSAHWLEVLRETGVPISTVKFPMELFDDNQVAANKMLHTLSHPTAGDITMVGPPLSLDEDGFVPGHATAAFGSETKALLAELGFSQAQINQLISNNITHTGE